MARKLRPQSDRIEWPLTPRQVEAMDSMFDELYKGVKEVQASAADDTITLDDLDDVDASAPNDNDVLTWDSATSTWINSPIPTLTLNDLTDVIIAAPVDDQFLRYNGTNWVNETFSALSPPLTTPRFDWAMLSGWAKMPYAGAGSTMTVFGDIASWQEVGGASFAANTGNNGPFKRGTTTTTSGNSLRFNSGTQNWRTQYACSGLFVIQTGPSVANVRIYIGFINTNATVTSDTPNQSYAMVRYSTDAGDANWKFQVGTATATLTTSGTSLGAIAADTIYVIRIWANAGGTSISAQINGGTIATITTTLPTNTTDHNALVSLETRTTAARSIDVQSVTQWIVNTAASTVMGAF